MHDTRLYVCRGDVVAAHDWDWSVIHYNDHHLRHGVVGSAANVVPGVDDVVRRARRCSHADRLCVRKEPPWPLIRSPTQESPVSPTSVRINKREVPEAIPPLLWRFGRPCPNEASQRRQDVDVAVRRSYHLPATRSSTTSRASSMTIVKTENRQDETHLTLIEPLHTG